MSNNGQIIEYKYVQDMYDGMLKMSSAMLKLGINTEKYELVLDDNEFEYLTHIIELSENHNFNKFYKRINKDEFSFSCFKVVRCS